MVFNLARPWITRLVLAMISVSMPLGCTDIEGERTIERVDLKQFRAEVYPVLLRDCGFPACHGATDRVFRVYGPGRVRLEQNGELPSAYGQASAREIGRTYDLALAHRDPNDLQQSMLLRKPLAIQAGGTTHQGVDRFGRDIYRTAQDTGYLAIARWVYSESPNADAEK